MNAAPAAKKRQSPEREDRQIAAVERVCGQFRQEVKYRRQTNEAEPDLAEVMDVPPVHQRLQNAAHREKGQQQISGGVNPREPEQRRQQEPLGNIERRPVPMMKGQQGADTDDGIRYEQNRRDVSGHFQPLIAGRVAEQYGGDADLHASIPKNRADHDTTGQHQARPAEAGN